MATFPITVRVTDSAGASATAITSATTSATSFVFGPAITDVASIFTINGNPYIAEVDTSKNYSLQKCSNVASNGALGDLHRFEIRSGDVSNIGSERAEWDGFRNTIPRGTEFWISYAIQVQPGAPIPFRFDGSFNIHGQCHQGAAGGNPDFYCWYQDDKFYFNVGNHSAPLANVDGNGDGTYFISPVLPRSVWHNVVYKVVKSSSGTADTLVTWFDGTQIYNQSGAAIMGEHTTGSYFKVGIYRSHGSGAAFPPEIVYYANVEVQTGINALLARVSNPIPFPAPS